MKNEQNQLNIKGKKRVETSEVLKPNTIKLLIKDVIAENTLSEKAKNELNKIKGTVFLNLATRDEVSNHTKLKILTLKQMLQRLPIALAQVKAGNNSENLLNEMRQIVHSLYQSKEITKKVYNNIIKSIQI